MDISFFDREEYCSHFLHFFNIFYITISALKINTMKSPRSTVVGMVAIIQVYVCKGVRKKREKLHISSQ